MKEDVLDILAQGGPVKFQSGQHVMRCPAHDDGTPSLAVKRGDTGLLVHCHAGCPPEAILGAVGLTYEDLFYEVQSTESPIIYEYTDESGTVLFEVVRKPNKEFRQRVKDLTQPSGYRYRLDGVRRVLYRLPEVIAAVTAGHEVWITEGEKDVEAVRHHATATTMPMGAGKWREEYTEFFVGASVTIWADRDDKGREHARTVHEALAPVASQVRIVESAQGKDAFDHLAAGLTLDQVLVTKDYEPKRPPVTAMLIEDYIALDVSQSEWVIRTLLRQREIMILTGFEGHGKSTMLKQIAVASACGVHPFNPLARLDPARVLFIDCENPRYNSVEDFRRLSRQVWSQGLAYNGNLVVLDNYEFSLDKPSGVEFLQEQVNAHQPDLLIIGPLYGLVDADLSDKETGAKAVRKAIRKVQRVSDCAVVIEHHAPHRVAGDARRSVRPIGSSLLMRWPDFGFGINPTADGDVNQPYLWEAWRGSRRRDRTWPACIGQAGVGEEGWFWQECEPPQDEGPKRWGKK